MTDSERTLLISLVERLSKRMDDHIEARNHASSGILEELREMRQDLKRHMEEEETIFAAVRAQVHDIEHGHSARIRTLEADHGIV